VPFLCFYSDDLYNEMKRLSAMAPWRWLRIKMVSDWTIRAEYKVEFLLPEEGGSFNAQNPSCSGAA
jgi:hypothetical protein